MNELEPAPSASPQEQELDTALLGARLRIVGRDWRQLLGALAIGGVLGLGISFAVTPRFLSSTLFIPPQQQQGGAGAALASLGALSSLIGGSGAVKNPADQYISMLQSVTVSDDIIKRFDLAGEYNTDYKEETRKVLAKRVTVTGGRKDGLIRVDVEDTDPKRAADMANAYVTELRTMTSHLALTEAQQRRVFFQRMLDESKGKLVEAQVALEATGFTAGALKAEPRSAGEVYARLRAELTMAQVKLQAMHGSLADSAPQVVQQQASVQALSDQVSRLEASVGTDANASSADYVGKYREFKYQSTLFELYAKQFELARLDESREGTLIQVVDEAQPAERKFFPRRSLFAALGAALAVLGVAIRAWRRIDAPADTGRREP